MDPERIAKLRAKVQTYLVDSSDRGYLAARLDEALDALEATERDAAADLADEKRRYAELRAGVEALAAEVAIWRENSTLPSVISDLVAARLTALSDTTMCPHTGQSEEACICMIHDPDGAHYRARLPLSDTTTGDEA